MVGGWRPASQKSWHRKGSPKTQISFLFLLGVFPLCFHFPSFTWDDLPENISSTIFKCSSSFWLPQGQTQFLVYYCLFFFFGQRASIEQSPNKSTAFSSKVVQKCFTKARRQWGSHLPSEAKWPAWGHTVGHSRAHSPCDSSALSHQETLLNLYIKQAQTG